MVNLPGVLFSVFTQPGSEAAVQVCRTNGSKRSASRHSAGLTQCGRVVHALFSVAGACELVSKMPPGRIQNDKIRRNTRGQDMPKLLRSSETAGCGATIELDNGEVVYVSIAQTGVLVRRWDMNGGLIKSLLSNFFGPNLYNESSVYKNAQTGRALSQVYPEQASPLSFKNPVLAAFSNAIWHCPSALEVCTVLNEAVVKVPQLEQDADTAALQKAFDAANNWPPKRTPEMTPATYKVVYSDGVTQDTCFIPAEIENWVAESNKADANKPYRIVRIIDSQARVVWDVYARQSEPSGAT